MKTAVLLMGFGGPGRPEDVEPFMRRMMGDRPLPPGRMDEIKKRYDLIGGKSPLLDITKKQAKALEEALNTGNDGYRVYVGMLNWHPFIAEVLGTILEENPDRLVALSLNPYFTMASTGRYFAELERSLQGLGSPVEPIEIRSYCDEPLFIDALSETVYEGFCGVDEALREDTDVVFTAHNIPAEMVDTGDPYADQVRETVHKVSRQSSLDRWHLAWQSSGKTGKWLEPDVDGIIEKLSIEGRRSILVVPAGFVSDHIETLYDLDIKMKEKTESLGMKYQRAPSLNVRSSFINALAQTVHKHIA